MSYSIEYKECQEYALLSNIKKFNVFIETGTAFGNTVYGMIPYFKEIHSIELNPDFYKFACYNLKNYKNVNLHLGDSSKILPDVLKNINENIIFFLDAHWSGYNTARGEKDVPLLDELNCIINYVKKESIVIIDDYRLFSTKKNEDWSEITINNIFKILENRVDRYIISNDRFVICLRDV